MKVPRTGYVTQLTTGCDTTSQIPRMCCGKNTACTLWTSFPDLTASGVVQDFTYGTKLLESFPPIQVSDRAYYNLASNGIKPHGRRRKSQISVDGADRRIARVHGTRYGPLSTKLRWHVALSCIVVVPRHAREEASAMVRSPMHSPLQMRRRIL